MMNINAGFKIAEIGLDLMAGLGANTVVREAVKQFTPENLSTGRKLCVVVAGEALASGVGAICCKAIKEDIKKTKNATEKVMSIFVKETESEPVIEVEGDEPVEIEE